MNPDDKKKLQNDILLAAEISRQFDLKQPEEARKVVAFLHDRKPFLSPRGVAFQQRMEALATEEEIARTCMLCMQKEAERGIFCTDCLAVVDRSVNRDESTPKKQQNEPEEVLIDETLSEEVSEELPVQEDVLEEPLAPREARIPELVELDPAVEKDFWGSSEKELKKFPTWARVLIILFVAVMIAVGILVATGYHWPKISFPGGGEVHFETQEEGQAVVSKKFSEEDYYITDKDSLSAPEGMFDVRVGDYVGDSWDTGLIDVFAYSVVSKENPDQTAILWVAPDGRTVGYGTLIDAENPDKMYRIK